MFAKVLIICIAFTAAHSSLIAPIGYNAPIHSAGLLGVGKGLFAAPAVATVSSQKAVINHVAPSARVAVAPVPVALDSHRIQTNRLVGGHGIGAYPLAIGAGIYGTPIVNGIGHLGLGHGVVSQNTVVNHVSPAAPVAVAAPVALASHGIYGNGIITSNGLLADRLVGGHGIAASPLAAGHGLLGAPVTLGHGAAVSSQKSVINHVAPAAPVVAAAPVGLTNHGIYGNGVVGSYGPLENGFVGGHGVAVGPLAIGNGLLGAPVALGHGTAVSSQKSVISHVAPAARVAVAAAPVALTNSGYLSSGLIGGHGIVGNGLVAGAHIDINGHGLSALPLSIGNGIHGSPLALGLGKAIL